MGTDRTRLPGRWFRLVLTLPRADEDDLTGLLALHGCGGTSARPAGPGRLRLEAWFEGEAQARAAAGQVGGRPGVTAGAPEPVEDPGWLAAALAPREPLRAGRFVVVDRTPEGAARDAFTIVLPPGRAFGTGEHATTRMCLQLLDESPPAEDTLALDLGTGSAILAIAAVRLGARRVAALDVDPHVLDVARENAALNGAADRIGFAAATAAALAPAARFALVLANIHRTALVRAAPALARRLVPGGRAILSGFSPQDADLVAGAWIAQGARLAGRRDEGEWTALALARA